MSAYSHFAMVHPETTEHQVFDAYYQDSTVHAVARIPCTSGLGCDAHGDKGIANVLKVIHTDSNGVLCYDEYYQECWADETLDHQYESHNRYTFTPNTEVEDLLEAISPYAAWGDDVTAIPGFQKKTNMT